MQNLEEVKHSMGKLISQHVDLDESSNAINQIFPPDQYCGNKNNILQEN
jgi:hypothetical protein